MRGVKCVFAEGVCYKTSGCTLMQAINCISHTHRQGSVHILLVTAVYCVWGQTFIHLFIELMIVLAAVLSAVYSCVKGVYQCDFYMQSAWWKDLHAIRGDKQLVDIYLDSIYTVKLISFSVWAEGVDALWMTNNKVKQVELSLTFIQLT